MGFFEEDKQRRENLTLEYRALFDAIWNRGKSVWLVNSVLLPGSILLVLQATIYRKDIGNMASGLFSILSVLLVMYCLLFIASTDNVNKICWERIHEIERQLGMSERAGNRLIRDEVRNRWWYPIRKYQWYVLLLILITIILHISVLNFLGWKLIQF